jgi:hypothetical protein
MKFLCIPCDTPMKLQSVSPPERGSLSVVYTCPECGYQMAMLTNAAETQVVQSLGVRIGPVAAEGATTSNCPFASMLPTPQGVNEGSSLDAEQSGSKPADSTTTIRWTAGAEARLERIPAFVRPMARTGIERFARENGATEIDEKLLDAAREFFGM